MKRAVVGIFLGLALSAAGIALVGVRIGEPPRIERIWPLAPALAVVLSLWLIQGVAASVLVRPYITGLQLREMTRIYLAAQAVGGLTPFGGVEIPYQMLLFKRLGIPAGVGVAVVIVKSVLNGTVLVAGAVVAFLSISRPAEFGSTVLIVAIAVVVGVWALMLLGASRAYEDGRRSVGSGWRARLANLLRDSRDSFARLWSREPRAIVACAALMTLYWILYPLLGILALMAAGWSGEGWPQVFLVQFLIYLLIPLSPTPGNSGGAEVAFATLAAAYVAPGTLVGGVLTWRLLNHYLMIVVGGFFAGRGAPQDLALARQELGRNE
ncbi:MAG: lysylphosphatidylglycerol synthase transmembrane domain-containing protein [Rubrobacteraceae bacterium]